MDLKKAKGKQMEMGGRKEKGANAYKSARMDDQNEWEENRLVTSGAASRNSVDLDAISTETEDRVQLLVHQIKPPFLTGRVAFSTQQKGVATVKDNSSDFSRMARDGSASLRQLRETKDKGTMRQRFWELGNTKMGDAIAGKNTDTKTSADEQVS